MRIEEVYVDLIMETTMVFVKIRSVYQNSYLRLEDATGFIFNLVSRERCPKREGIFSFEKFH